MTLVEMLEAQARERPEQLALISREDRYTYNEFNKIVNQLASAFLNRGLKSGDLVYFMLPRVPELIFTFLAAAKARGVVAPINFDFPGRLIKEMLQRTKPRFLVVHASLIDQAVRVLPLDTPPTLIVVGHAGRPPGIPWDEFIRGEAAGNPGLSVAENDLVYLNYTSGATGGSKGALTTHAHLYWNTKAAVETLELTQKDIHLCLFAPFAHPHELLCRPLYLGGTAVLLDNIRPKAIARAIMDHKVTCFMGLVPFYITLMEIFRSGQYDFSSLRIPESGGMHTRGELVEEFKRTIGVPIVPVWGSTETTGIAIANVPGQKRAFGSMGRPCRYYEIKIVSVDGLELEPDEVGELVFRGPGVVNGYLEADANGNNFFQDGWFFSGDLARRDAEGNFYFVERKSGMLKVAGHRVYPLEIELALLKHPAVKEAAVIGINDGLRGEVPKAFVVLEDSKPVDRKELIECCQEHLAHFKVPKIFEFRESLPKIGSGKINKKQLT
jgi:long-chain acyl-CoA synthetase